MQSDQEQSPIRQNLIELGIDPDSPTSFHELMDLMAQALRDGSLTEETILKSLEPTEVIDVE